MASSPHGRPAVRPAPDVPPEAGQAPSGKAGAGAAKQTWDLGGPGPAGPPPRLALTAPRAPRLAIHQPPDPRGAPGPPEQAD